MKKPIQKVLSGLSNHDFYIKHLKILNPILNVELTNKEIEVLAAFMMLECTDEERFDTRSRKKVMQLMNQKPGGLGNYLTAFDKKKFTYTDEEGILRIKSFLYPDSTEQGYQFKIQKQ